MEMAEHAERMRREHHGRRLVGREERAYASERCFLGDGNAAWRTFARALDARAIRAVASWMARAAVGAGRRGAATLDRRCRAGAPIAIRTITLRPAVRPRSTVAAIATAAVGPVRTIAALAAIGTIRSIAAASVRTIRPIAAASVRTVGARAARVAIRAAGTRRSAIAIGHGAPRPALRPRTARHGTPPAVAIAALAAGILRRDLAHHLELLGRDARAVLRVLLRSPRGTAARRTPVARLAAGAARVRRTVAGRTLR